MEKKGVGWVRVGGRSVIKMRAEERSTREISREMCAYKGLGMCVERMCLSRCVCVCAFVCVSGFALHPQCAVCLRGDRR